jgi:hypothetical protein
MKNLIVIMIIVINKINGKNTIIASLNIRQKNVNLNAKPRIVKQNIVKQNIVKPSIVKPSIVKQNASRLPIKQNAK